MDPDAAERADVPPPVPRPAGPASVESVLAEPLHPRLGMQGPLVGRLGTRRLPDLGPLPYAQMAREPVPAATRAKPVAAVVVAGALVASGTAVWATRGSDPARTVLEEAWGGGASAGAVPSGPTSGTGPAPPPSAPGPAAPPSAGPPAAAVGGAQGVAPAPAAAEDRIDPEAWFADGRLILVGAVPDQRIADALVGRAETVVGAGAVVDGLTIDPSAPVPAGLPVVVAEQIRFGVERHDVTAEYLPLVEAWKAVLDAHPSVVMRITGHTDSTGPLAYNEWLSAERAAAVAGWMQDRGVAADRFVVEGRGPAEPVASNSSPQSRAENRRIQVVLDGLLMV